MPFATYRWWWTMWGLVGLAWIGLYILSLEHPAPPLLGALSTSTTPEWWRALCAVSPNTTGFQTVFVMWALMAGAMMLPTALPFLGVYAEVASNSTQPRTTSVTGVVSGYLLTWLTYAMVASGLQVWLADQGALTPHGITASSYLAAGLLAAAGLYQLSPIKIRFLAQCQQPMHFLLSHWRGGRLGAFQLGVSHGLACVGCCWALMLLAFVGGTMNLAWMGVATLLMGFEKFSKGHWVRLPVGLTLLTLAGMVASTAFGTIWQG